MSNPGQPYDPVMALAAQQPMAMAAPQMQQGIDPVMALAQSQNAPAPPDQQSQAPNDWRMQLMASPIGGMMHGIGDTMYGAGQLAGKVESGVSSLGGMYPNTVSNYYDQTVSDLDKRRKLADQTYATARDLNGGNDHFDSGRLVGNVVSPVNAIGGEISTGSRLANALLQGGYYSATQPVDTDKPFWQQKIQQTELGMGTGGITHGLGSAASAMISPKISDSARTLLNAKVPLTIGQTLGGSAQRLEDASTSIPFVGDLVKARQREAFIGLNTAALNRGLEPIGKTLPAGLEGHQAVEYVQNALGDAYNSIIPHLSAVADSAFKTDINNIANNATRDYGLVGPSQQKLADILKNQVVGKANNGAYDGATLKDIQSNLSYQARTHAKSLNPDDKNLADALIDTKGAVDDLIARQNPNEAPELAAINRGYANFARPQAAAERSTKGGVFTPAQLAMAVRAGGTRSQNATGNSLMQDLSSAGQDVLPSTVPDSGTPFRHAVQAGIGLAGAGLGGEHFVPQAPAYAMGAAGLGSLLAAGGTKTAQDAMRFALTRRPANAAQLAKALKDASPRASVAFSPLLLNASQNNGPY